MILKELVWNKFKYSVKKRRQFRGISLRPHFKILLTVTFKRGIPPKMRFKTRLYKIRSSSILCLGILNISSSMIFFSTSVRVRHMSEGKFHVLFEVSNTVLCVVLSHTNRVYSFSHSRWRLIRRWEEFHLCRMKHCSTKDRVNTSILVVVLTCLDCRVGTNHTAPVPLSPDLEGQHDTSNWPVDSR
jgi:hypothetical protein